jgi:hypothetical protein
MPVQPYAREKRRRRGSSTRRASAHAMSSVSIRYRRRFARQDRRDDVANVAPNGVKHCVKYGLRA